MTDLPAGKGGGPSPFVNAFDHAQLDSLRYNTSQAGSALHLCYGTQRITVNLLEFWGFSGKAGGKGGKGLGGSGGKKGSNQQYSVNVAFGLCQSPVSFQDGAGSLAGWGRYCQAARLAMSLLLDRQQAAARWLEEVAQLTASAVLWSGNLLKIVPYGDVALSANGASWSPDLTWQYALTDAD